MKEILSKSSYFLIFSGFISWLLFGLNLYEKLFNIHDKFHVEFKKGLENIKNIKNSINLIDVKKENLEKEAFA